VLHYRHEIHLARRHAGIGVEGPVHVRIDRDRASPGGDEKDEGSLLRSLIGREPDPAFAAEVAEECRRLLALLPDDELRRVALLKLEGHTNEEIAAEVKRSLATVERWLGLIRKHWAAALPG
jgi:DNA-directed RNA polymerase specialized sigma24 family protein